MQSGSVDVVIPLFNAGPFIREAIDSVFAQTHAVGEVIVVDDASLDDGPAVAAAIPGVRLVRRPHSGMGETINHGVSLSRAEFLSFLDADDLWAPEKTADQLRAFAEDPGLDAVSCHVRNFSRDSSGGKPAEVTLGVFPGAIRTPLMIRRASFDRVGPFCADPKVNHFIGWYARAMDAGLRFGMLPEVRYHRRIHDSNFGRVRTVEEYAGYLASLRSVLARRRAAEGRECNESMHGREAREGNEGGNGRGGTGGVRAP